MEKYARQALSEGIKNAEDLHVSVESELYRVLNLHYNRNNHIEVSQPDNSTQYTLYTFPSLSFLTNNKAPSPVVWICRHQFSSPGAAPVQMGG